MFRRRIMRIIVTMDDSTVDNRDDYTTWLHLPNGVTLEVTRQDLLDLLDNMTQGGET